MIKSVLWVSDHVQHSPVCTVTEDDKRLDIQEWGWTSHVTKTKALISYEVTAQLICAVVFAYARCCFSHDPARTGTNYSFDISIIESGVVILSMQ